MLYRTTARPAQAEVSLRRAQAIREEILREFPAQGDYRKALAEDYSELSRIHWSSSRPIEAEAALRKCLTTLEELTRDNPDVSEYQDSLAASYNSLGSFILNSGRGEFNEIETAYRKALDIRELLARDHPKVHEYQSELARVYNNLALWHFVANHDDRSAENYAKALSIREELARKHPDVIAYQKAAAKTHHDLGLLFRRARRWVDADRSFHQALAIQERLLERNREISDFAIERATTINNLGLLSRDQGKNQDAFGWYTRAIRDFSDVLRTEPQHTDVRRLLGQAYAGRAGSLTNLEHDSEALADWDRSLEFTRSDLIPGSRLGRAATLAHLGNYAEAVAEADRLTPKEGHGKVYLTASARVYAAAASAAFRDPKLNSEDRRRRTEEFAARAMELLTRGYESGEFNTKAEAASLQIDRDFETLRSRADFISLLQRIEAK
jgi:tetratricopeptide (TPR) repeat protein